MWFVVYCDHGLGEEHYGKGETKEKAWTDLNLVCEPYPKDCKWYHAKLVDVVVKQTIEFISP